MLPCFLLVVSWICWRLCTQYKVSCKLYSVQCIVYSVSWTCWRLCTQYTVSCKMYSVQCTVYSVSWTCWRLCTQNTVSCKLYSVQCTVYSVSWICWGQSGIYWTTESSVDTIVCCVLCEWCNLKCAVCSVKCVVCSVKCVVFSVHSEYCAMCTLNTTQGSLVNKPGNQGETSSVHAGKLEQIHLCLRGKSLLGIFMHKK